MTKGVMLASLAFFSCLWGMSVFAQDNPPPVPESGNFNTDCVPACRKGFICVSGVCVSECNPPCPADKFCVNHDCINEQPAPAVEPTSQAAPENVEPQRKGFIGTALTGVSLCVKRGSSTCANSDPGFGGAIGLGYRFLPYVGFTADAFLGMYTVSQYKFVGMFGVFAGPKFYLPVWIFDFSVSLGLGFVRMEADSTNNDTTGSSGFGLSVAAGAEARLGRLVGLGIGFRMNFTFASTWCVNGSCSSIDPSSNAANAIFGCMLTW